MGVWDPTDEFDGLAERAEMSLIRLPPLKSADTQETKGHLHVIDGLDSIGDCSIRSGRLTWPRDTAL
jgi:hypothetical protein